MLMCPFFRVHLSITSIQPYKSINPFIYYTGAPWELKSAYAFRIYDFNCDAYLCQDDIEETIISITSITSYNFY